MLERLKIVNYKIVCKKSRRNRVFLRKNKTNYIKPSNRTPVIIKFTPFLFTGQSSRLVALLDEYYTAPRIKRINFNILGPYTTNSVNTADYKFITNYKYHKLNQVLNLNFSRNKFFPNVRPLYKGDVFVTLSLGLFWKYFFKPKCFKKNKTMYLTTASFLRKVMLFCSFTDVNLLVNRVPRYLNEILAKINDPAISVYNHPFTVIPTEVVEQTIKPAFFFSSVMFFGNKNYGLLKIRKRGRLKRKIYRRLISINRVLD